MRNDTNTGYTLACNTGIRLATNENVLLLNPDTKVTEDALSELVHKLSSDDAIGAAAPQLLNDDGSIQYSVRTLPKYRDMFFELKLLSSVFPKSRFFARWKMHYFDHNHTADVDQPMAAALLIKKRVIEEVNYMDERFKMFFNDVDLCKKIKDAGYKIMFYPEAKIVHSKGVSIYKDRANMIRIWTDDALKYFKKHHFNIILYPLLFLGLKISSFFRIMYYKLKS